MTRTRVSDELRAVAVRTRRAYPAPLLTADLVAFVPAFAIAGLLRGEVSAIRIDWLTVVQVAAIALAAFAIAGFFGQLYRGRYRVATFEEVLVVGFAWGFSTAVAAVVNLVLFAPRVPHSIVSVGMMLVGLSMLSTRVVWRLIVRAEVRPDAAGRKKVIVFGAGEAGESVIRSMLRNPKAKYVPIGLIDDDPRKQNLSIEGIRVLGTTDDLPVLASSADVLLIAIPNAQSSLIEKVSNQAAVHSLDVMILPSTTELFGMMATIDAARPIQITDLLGRDEVEIDHQSVANYLAGNVVLVTGAGGSIGSELCRQIQNYSPKRLVMLDRDETALQAVELSLDGHGLLDDENLVLADVRDRAGVFAVFEKHRPSIVFHAAALKHLPLLESHPREGLLTNVLGSQNVIDAAASIGVDHFVNISTDKAANPISVLGTTKRLAEALTVKAGLTASGQFISVRFGNVIGSRGSVLPIFESQIAAGHALTVTHPDVTRFFMSIPEASRLVLQAGAIGRTGETLVLDMGKPVKILELAEKLLRHHKSDVGIEFTGLRPNEKMHEELGHEGETMIAREHERIWHTEAAVVGICRDLGALATVDPAEIADKLLRMTQHDQQVNAAGSTIDARSTPDAVR